MIIIGAEHQHRVSVEHAEDPTLAELIVWAEAVQQEALRQGAPPDARVRHMASVDVEWTTRATS